MELYYSAVNLKNETLHKVHKLCQYQSYHKRNEGYSWNRRTCICEDSKNIKTVADNLVADSDEIIIVLDIVSTRKDKCYGDKNGKHYEYCFNKLS